MAKALDLLELPALCMLGGGEDGESLGFIQYLAVTMGKIEGDITSSHSNGTQGLNF